MFQKGKEAEVAWMDAEIAVRDSHLDRTQVSEEEEQEEPMERKFRKLQRKLCSDIAVFWNDFY